MIKLKNDGSKHIVRLSGIIAIIVIVSIIAVMNIIVVVIAKLKMDDDCYRNYSMLFHLGLFIDSMLGVAQEFFSLVLFSFYGYQSKVCFGTLLQRIFDYHQLECKFFLCNRALHLGYEIGLHTDAIVLIPQSIFLTD